jgi:integrase
MRLLHHIFFRCGFNSCFKELDYAFVRDGVNQLNDLRLTYLNLLLAQGEIIKHIQAQLGHSSPMVTLNVCSHLMEQRNPEAASRLEGAIFGDR